MRESGATRILLGKILDFFLLVIMTRYRHALAFFFFFLTYLWAWFLYVYQSILRNGESTVSDPGGRLGPFI